MLWKNKTQQSTDDKKSEVATLIESKPNKVVEAKVEVATLIKSSPSKVSTEDSDQQPNGDKPKGSLKASKLSVIPLGGLEEIGKNSAVIQYEDEMVIVDLGLAFPNDDMPGVDIVVPDHSYIHRNANKLKAVILTHGHEDHIGGLPHFFKSFPKKDVPIYGSSFTLGLIRNKVKEKFKGRKFDLRAVAPRDRVKVGKYIDIEFISTTHSIPECFAVAIHTPEGTIIHTGDYKFDLTPVDGKLADFYKLAELGEKGVLLLMSDSTNANKEDLIKSEKTVARAFEDVMRNAPGRVIVSAFSSHAHRVQEVIKVSHTLGRKTALDGKSMLKVFDISEETGSVVIPKGALITTQQTHSLPDEKVTVVCTGTQGETAAALSRIARGSHRDIKIGEGDTVIISANAIPGNERGILSIVNMLMKKGAKVYHHGTHGLHVSGHGARHDIRLMLNLTRPRFFMPVHGEYMHLQANKELGMEFGMKSEDIVLTKNGDRVSVSKKGIKVDGSVESGNILIDNRNLSSIDENVIRDRQMMSQDGLLVVNATVNIGSKQLKGAPEIVSKGFSISRFDGFTLKDMSVEIAADIGDKRVDDIYAFKKDLRDSAIKFLRKKSQKNPMIISVVTQA